MPRLFKASFLGYNRREVESAVDELGQSLDSMQARLAETNATLALREAELQRRTAHIEELEKVADRLAHYVVERDGRLRELRTALAREQRDREKLRTALESARKRARESASAPKLRPQRSDSPEELPRTASARQ